MNKRLLRLHNDCSLTCPSHVDSQSALSHFHCIARHQARCFQILYHSEQADILEHLYKQQLIQVVCVLFFKTLTCLYVAKLMAHHSCINIPPLVVTHCAPLLIDAHLHSSLIVTCPTPQPEVSVITSQLWRLASTVISILMCLYSA